MQLQTAISEIKKGESIGTIEAVKTVSDIFAPYTGKVVEINEALKDSPEVVNSDPYGKGWMIKVEMSEPSEADALLSAEDYKKITGS